MKRPMVHALLAAGLVFVNAGHVFAYGRGGSFHAASVGGYHAAAVGGYHAAAVGGYHGAAVGGYRAGTVGGYRGAEVGGFRGAEVGGYRAGTVGGYRGLEGGHVGMATDFGFGHVAGARGYVGPGHYTTAYPGSVLAARGVAVRGGFYHYGAFNTGWWGVHPGAWRVPGWTAATCWGWATVPVLTNWFGWSAPPIYYDFGNTIVYQGDQVYINGDPGPTAADYYQQSADLALAPPPPEKKDEQWQPLGVFALVQGEQTDPSAVFQLAVNKAGYIGGNYYNVLTDTNLPVRGSVDKKTQRASWIVGDQKNTVYDTGIYNLTKDESPLLIHFGKDRTQQWLLVRVPEKDGMAPPTAPANEESPAPPNEEGTCKVTVLVPADAELDFNGTQMSQTGTERVFVTPPLEPGSNYRYTIRARWTEDGKPVEQTRKVGVKPGGEVRVDFTSPLP
jgi:uncharacterized protein (TIGR03000 family)